MKKVTLAIRGGGVKTPAIGVLKAFEENHIEVARVSGTSMGAVIATLVAIDTPAQEIERLFKKYVVAYSTTRNSKIIEDTVNEQCNYVKFKDLKKPLYMVANMGGLWNTKAYVFSKETTPNITVGEACRASCSFPFIYYPYKMNIAGEKIRFYDGGMAMNPLLPEKDDTITVLSTFLKSKVNMKSRYKNAWLQAEDNADFIIKPYIGKMGSRGKPEDIKLSRIVGYYEAKEKMKDLLKLLSE